MSESAVIPEVRQLITRVDDELAEAVRQQAQRTGQSVNAYVTRLLRVAVTAPAPATSDRQMWRAAALADGRLTRRGIDATPRGWTSRFDTAVQTPAGYASGLVAEDRDEWDDRHDRSQR